MIFVAPGMNVNCQYYRDVLLSQQMLPTIKRVARARDTIQLLHQATSDFIGPDLWSPDSPDLNPVDYNIWGVVHQRVYKCRVSNINELKQRIVKVWDDLPVSYTHLTLPTNREV